MSFKAVIAAKKKLKMAEAAAKKLTEAEAVDPLEHAAASPSGSVPAGAYPPQLPKTPAAPPGTHLPPMPTMGSVSSSPAAEAPNADANRLKLGKKKNLMSSLNKLFGGGKGEGIIHRSNTLVGAPPMVPGKLSSAEIEKGNDDPKAPPPPPPPPPPRLRARGNLVGGAEFSQTLFARSNTNP